ncbi:hypothetical protein [Aeromonas veronii]|uniref:hypothetical protein n=1 Tax=Aeromonas veronii TaxID=654 RepID=UPI003B9FAAFB
MAGTWERRGTVTVTQDSNIVTGVGTYWTDAQNGPQVGNTFYGPDGQAHEVSVIRSATELWLADDYKGATATGVPYQIDTTRVDSVPGLASRVAAVLGFAQGQYDNLDKWTQGGVDEDVTLTSPNGESVTVPSLPKMGKDYEEVRNAEGSGGKLMRVGGPAIIDSERYSLERATGGSQTIIRDSAGNANAMFVLPRFSYADLGMTADMGTGDVTAFDFGSGSIKSEIFIGAYLASGSGAVSAPRQDPSASLDHTAARNACSAKGAGWHLMTAHEWAAIALWCMANGFEPIGNTNWGRSHAQSWMVGVRADKRAPGDAAGTGRTQTGSMGSEATHTRTLGGIADLVGNVWEWQDGLLLQDGRFKISAHNTQAEVDWAFVDAYLDASSLSGGSAILSSAITNRLGALGDNANAGNAAGADWRSMTKAGGYVSLQALRRLLVEPAGVLPQGLIYMRNFGERLPFRGGSWNSGAGAGLAALILVASRVYASTDIGFRPAFA